MACTISCMISAIFIIGMIYFYNITDKSKIVKHYKEKLPSNLQKAKDQNTHPDQRSVRLHSWYQESPHC